MLVIAALISVTTPVVRGIFSDRNFSNGVDAISGYFSYARAQAISRNTFVLVGFYQASGSDDLRMGSVVSINGLFNPAGFDSSNVVGAAANYPALGNIVHINNVTLTPEPNLPSPLQSKLQLAQAIPDGVTTVDCSASSNASFSNNPSALSFTTLNTSFVYAIILFSPQGEAFFFPKSAGASTNFSASFPFYSQLFIGLRATRGGAVAPGDQNAAAITLDGASGDIKAYRL